MQLQTIPGGVEMTLRLGLNSFLRSERRDELKYIASFQTPSSFYERHRALIRRSVHLNESDGNHLRTRRLQIVPVLRKRVLIESTPFQANAKKLGTFHRRDQKFPGLKKISEELLGVLGAFHCSTCGRFPSSEKVAIVSHGILKRNGTMMASSSVLSFRM
jgi:hypothetical protein